MAIEHKRKNTSVYGHPTLAADLGLVILAVAVLVTVIVILISII